MSWLKENSIHFIIPIMVAILSTLLTQWYKDRDSRMRYLDYYATESPNLLESIEEMGDTTNFSVNSKTVAGLGMLEIIVQNNSDVDFEDVLIFIDLLPREENELRLLSSNYFDHNNSKESVTLEGPAKSNKANGLRTGYRIKTVNRGKEQVFKVKYLFEGEGLPNYEVQIDKKGANIRKFNLEKIEDEYNKQAFINNLLVVILGLITLLMVTIYRGSMRRKLINSLLLQHLEEMETSIRSRTKGNDADLRKE